jgi:hypothetical protein
MKTLNVVKYILIFVLLCNTVSACLCAKSNVVDAYNNSKNIFVGTVILIEDTIIKDDYVKDFPGSYYLITFDIKEKIKNKFTETKFKVLTEHGGAACGFKFELGKEYLVYTEDLNKAYELTNTCTRTSIMVNVKKCELRKLRKLNRY